MKSAIFIHTVSPICNVSECLNQALSNGYCDAHQPIEPTTQLELPGIVPDAETNLADLQADFRSRVIVDRKTGCWNWTGARAVNGYGLGRDRQVKKQDYSHRIAYRLWNGSIPKGKIVRHSCDNRTCSNPEHLQLGSHKENTADMFQRGRANKSNAKRRRLSVQQVKDIKSAIKSGASGYNIAKTYKVTESCVSSIRRGIRFKSIKPDGGYDLRKYGRTRKPGRKPNASSKNTRKAIV